MFESVAASTCDVAIEAVYRAVRLLTERSAGRWLAAVAAQPDPGPDAVLAVGIVDEVQRDAGALIENLSDDQIGRYVAELSGALRRSLCSWHQPDRARGRRLLAALRRDHPFPRAALVGAGQPRQVP